eukprot:TRINITY_DN15098_c0_g1_i2.p2 TRINITY_DN15098_c0_g1~~TRINITY_DN15098_c0_g1_i2.p2  ORF type:complete len:202 (+),score=78.18 TRINITY_DN15098_c0_g1_i2:265-870(+)
MVNMEPSTKIYELCSSLRAQRVRGVKELGSIVSAVSERYPEAQVTAMQTRPAYANIFLQRMSFFTMSFPTSELLLFIPNFAEAWELRKPTPDYAEVTAKLARMYPNFVGTEAELEKVLTAIARHVRFCMVAKGLDIPPWRTSECWKRVFIERDPVNITIVTRDWSDEDCDAEGSDSATDACTEASDGSYPGSVTTAGMLSE